MDKCTGLPKNLSLNSPPLNGWLSVKDSLKSPFRYCSLIEISFNHKDISSGEGTGTLIGENLVITAAHVLWPNDDIKLSNISDVAVTPGRNRFKIPFGVSLASKIVFPKRYKPPTRLKDGSINTSSMNFENDYSLIVTRDNIGLDHADDDSKSGAGFWGNGIKEYDSTGTTIGAIPEWRSGQYKVNVCGYPKIKGGNSQWRSYDSTLSKFKSPGLIFFKNKVCQGHSGSPVWITRSRFNGGRILFAIFVGWKLISSKKVQACGRLIDDKILKFINDVRKGKKVGRVLNL